MRGFRVFINCTLLPLLIAGGVASAWAPVGQEASLFGATWLLSLLCMGAIELLEAFERQEEAH